MSARNTVLLGYSGHAYVASDCLLPEFRASAYLDTEQKEKNPKELEYLGSESTVDIDRIRSLGPVFPAVGSNSLREKFVQWIRQNKLEEIQAVHPTASVSSSAKVGQSTLIGPNAIVNAIAVLGDGVIVNSGSIVEHECVVEDYVHLAPGCAIAGNVTVKKGAFLGANVTVKEGITIGKYAIVGAGSVVLEDIPDNELWAGVPAEMKRIL